MNDEYRRDFGALSNEAYWTFPRFLAWVVLVTIGIGFGAWLVSLALV